MYLYMGIHDHAHERGIRKLVVRAHFWRNIYDINDDDREHDFDGVGAVLNMYLWLACMYSWDDGWMDQH